MTARTRVFLSHSPEDGSLLGELLKHLAPLERSHDVELWHELQIRPGEERAIRVEQFVRRADIIVVLVSPDFLASTECLDGQLEQALRREADGTARLIPVIVRHASWQTSSLKKFQPLPKNGKPVTAAPNRDEAWFEVTEGIRIVIQEERERSDLTAQNHRLRQELASKEETLRQANSEREILASRYEELQRASQAAAAQERGRIASSTEHLLGDLRNVNERNTVLTGQIASLTQHVATLTQQIASLTQQLGGANREQQEQVNQIDSLKGERQQNRDDLKKLRQELKHAKDALTLIENKKRVRGEAVISSATHDVSMPNLVTWEFCVKNSGEGVIKLIRAEINWCFAPSVTDFFSGLFRTNPASSNPDPPLVAWEPNDFPGSPSVGVGATSDSFQVQLDLTSAVCQQILKQHSSRVPDRSQVGWSKAVRPMLKIVIEGQANKHREVIDGHLLGS